MSDEVIERGKVWIKIKTALYLNDQSSDLLCFYFFEYLKI